MDTMDAKRVLRSFDHEDFVTQNSLWVAKASRDGATVKDVLFTLGAAMSLVFAHVLVAAKIRGGTAEAEQILHDVARTLPKTVALLREVTEEHLNDERG